MGEEAAASWFLGARGTTVGPLPAILTSREARELSVTVTDDRGRRRVLQYSTVPLERELTLVAIFGLDVLAETP